ncbi:hypothetical protein [Exiguobacterium sp. S22-S28]|uniref:hypothetical protein n=1 Tax=Exiguobacterium sp. S22-S28 TaxID=3342768 RepID=UPI00372CFDC3
MIKRYEKEKKDFDQYSETVDKQFNDFRESAQKRFNQRLNEKSEPLKNTITQSPWFDALQNGKI